MNLSKRLRQEADFNEAEAAKFPAHAHDSSIVDVLHLAADIIDSLPKAEDGSVIWKWCYVVQKILCDDGYMRRVSRVIRVFDDGAGEIEMLNDDGSIMGDPWEFEASEIMSTHRTREEAEAAAAKAGEKCNAAT